MTDYQIESTDFKTFKNGIYFLVQNTAPGAISISAHIHSSIEIIFVKEGSFAVWLDDEKYNIFAGDVILFRSNAIHHIVAGDDAVNCYYVLKIKPEVIRDLASPTMAGVYALNFAVNRFSSKCLWTKEDICRNAPLIQEGLSILINEFNGDRAYSDIALKIATGSIILDMMRTGAAVNGDLQEGKGEVIDAIYKAILYINSHYSEDISASQLCTLVGMSYSFFSRSFKMITGKRFKEYLNVTRINHAERLLATTDKTVSEVCVECGYSDVSYFIKVFRELRNLPPRAFKIARNI